LLNFEIAATAVLEKHMDRLVRITILALLFPQKKSKGLESCMLRIVTEVLEL